jgi:hypothetical protein
VVEGYLAPVAGIMALGTLAGVVIGRPGMAGSTIRKTSVIEDNLLPVAGIMALGALAREMIGRPGVAGLAIG